MNLDPLLTTASPAIHLAAQAWPPLWLLLAAAGLLTAGVWYTDPARCTRRREGRLHYLHQVLLIVETPAPPVEIIAFWTRRQRREVERYCHAMLFHGDDLRPESLPPYPACLRQWRVLASLHDAADDPAPAPTGTLFDLTARLHPRTPWPPDRRRCEAHGGQAGKRCRFYQGHAGPHETVDHESWYPSPPAARAPAARPHESNH